MPQKLAKIKHKSFALVVLALLLIVPYSSSLINPAKATDPPLAYHATGVAYTKGSSSGGDYTYTYTSNNVYHVSQAGLKRLYEYGYGWHWYNVLDMYYTVNVGKPGRALPNVAKIEVNGEAKTDMNTIGGNSVYFWILNYTASSWIPIGSFLGTTTDVLLSWTNTSNIQMQNFVDDQGNMKLRWNFISDNDLGDFSELYVDYLCVKLTMPQFKWLFLVYLDADWIRWIRDDMGRFFAWTGDENATGQINEMESVGSTSKVAVIVQVDWFDGNAERFFISKDADSGTITSPVLQNLGEVNMSQPQPLTDFINHSMTSFPADRVSLYLRNHGKGWQGVCEDCNGVYGNYSNPPPSDWLNMAELKTGLSDAKSQTGKAINLVGFEACLMQMEEVGYQIRNYANVMVASEEVMRADRSFHFDSILTYLTSNPTASEYSLGSTIVDYEHAQYTMSSVNVTKEENLATALDAYAASLCNKLSNTTIRNGISDCRAKAQQFFYAYYVDLYNFTKATLNLNDSDISTAANNLISAITNQLVLKEWHTSGYDAHGVSIFFPASAGAYSPVKTDYSTLDLSQRTGTTWYSFLNSYLDV